MTPNPLPMVSEAIACYQLTNSNDEPVHIINPKEMAREDADIAAQPGLFLLAPYAHDHRARKNTATFAMEFSLQNPREIFYDGKLFWTQAHALLYQQCQIIHDLVGGRKEVDNLLMQSLNIPRLMKQCQVGDDRSLADPQHATESVESAFTQFCIGYQKQVARTPAKKTAKTPLEQWQTKKQQTRYSVRLEYLRQYPEVLNVLLHCWQHGVIPIEINELSALHRADDTVPLKNLCLDIEIWVNVAYSMIDEVISDAWYEAFVSNLRQSINQITLTENGDILSHLQPTNTLQIVQSNLVPGTNFKHRVIDSTHRPQKVVFNETNQADLRCLQALLSDCQLQSFIEQPNFDFSTDSDDDSITSTDTLLSSDRYSVIGSGTTTPETSTSERSPAPAAAKSLAEKTPMTSMSATRVGAFRTAHKASPAGSPSASRLRTALMSPSPRPASLATLTPQPGTPSVTGTPVRFAKLQTPLRTAHTPRIRPAEQPLANNEVMTPKKLLFATPKQATSPKTPLPKKSSPIAHGQLTPEPVTPPAPIWPETPMTGRRAEKKSLLSDTNQPMLVVHAIEDGQPAVKILFSMTSVAELFRRRLTDRYGLDPETVYTENSAQYEETLDEDQSYQFAVVVPVKHVNYFWVLISQAEEMPDLFPHYGQAHLDLLETMFTFDATGKLFEVDEESPGFQFHAYLMQYTPEQGRLADYIKDSPHATPAYLAAAEKPNYSLLSLNLNEAEHQAMAKLVAQCHQPALPADQTTQAFEKRMQRWHADYRQESWGIDTESASAETADDNVAQRQSAPAIIDFGQGLLTDYIRDVNVVVTSSMIHGAQNTLKVHGWHGGARESFKIWKVKQGQDFQVETIESKKLIQSTLRGCIGERSKKTSDRVNKKDVGDFFFVSSTVPQLVDLSNGTCMQDKSKTIYSLPSISLSTAVHAEKYTYCETRAEQSFALFGSQQKQTFKINDTYEIDTQARYDALVKAAGSFSHRVLILSVEDVAVNAGDLQANIAEIKARCLAKALIKADHDLQLVFICAPVTDNNDMLYQQLDSAIALHSNSLAVRVVVANVTPSAAFGVVSRFVNEENDSEISQSVRFFPIEPRAIAEVVVTDRNYGLPLQVGISAANRANAPVQTDLVDSMRAVVQDPRINRRFNAKEAYEIVELPQPSQVSTQAYKS